MGRTLSTHPGPGRCAITGLTLVESNVSDQKLMQLRHDGSVTEMTLPAGRDIGANEDCNVRMEKEKTFVVWNETDL